MPSPDITLLLDMSIEASKKRGGFGRERYETERTQVQVRRIFQMLQKPEWKVTGFHSVLRFYRCPDVPLLMQIIDASRPAEQVHSDICSAVVPNLDRIAKSPLAYITLDL